MNGLAFGMIGGLIIALTSESVILLMDGISSLTGVLIGVLITPIFDGLIAEVIGGLATMMIH